MLPSASNNALQLSSSPTESRNPSNLLRPGQTESDLQESTEEDEEEDEDEDEDWRMDQNSNEHYSRFGDMENEAILHYGYLDKKGERRKTWKNRWFVLRKTTLVYYKNEKEYRLLRMIPLTDIHTCAEVQVKHHDNTFGIVTLTRTYYVRSKSRSERDQWIQKITQAKEQLRITNERSNVAPKSRSGDDYLLASSRTNTGILRSRTVADNRIGSPPKVSSLLDSKNLLHDEPQLSNRISPQSNPRSLNNNIFGTAFPAPPSSVGPSDTQYQQTTITKSFMQSVRKTSLKPESATSEQQSTPLGTMPDLSSAGSSIGLQDHISSSPQPPRSVQCPLISSSEDDDEPDDDQARLVATQTTLNSQITREVPHTQDNDLSNSNKSPQMTGERKLSLPEAGKTITQGYLMKQGKRKNWRKRYFLLTSHTLVYSKSHMNTAGKGCRSIPIARILDAIECCLTEPPLTSSQQPPHDHCFKIITSERTYLVNAPTEEDEIKWLSAIRCLLASYRANLPKPFGAILDHPLLPTNNGTED
ncbi:hypothetical protein BY996DRAFT_4573842 [Phakopsora pachyrhizi]|nr:hypothetical protein BY996DRAFT_4573842 [Phakopsora pachyrhizi]